MQKFKREVEVILMETNFLSGGTGLLHQDDKKITKGATYTFSRHFEALSSRHNSKANNHSNTRVNQCSRRHHYVYHYLPPRAKEKSSTVPYSDWRT